jgi:hypothetical protein
VPGAFISIHSKNAEAPLIRWMIVIFVALIFISWISPFLQKLGLGKLPGDFRFRAFGREWFLPFTTTILVSYTVALIVQLT